MSDVEESTAVRKTRSGRAVKTPARPKSAAKPAGRKTRKKVVVMEVEVTDDEDTEQSEEIEEPAGKKAKLDEDKLLEASDGETPDENNKNEDALLNSGDETDKKNESSELVMNDIEMLEEIIHTNEKITEKVGKNDETQIESKNTSERLVIAEDEKEVSEKKESPPEEKKENGVTKKEEKVVVEDIQANKLEETEAPKPEEKIAEKEVEEKVGAKEVEQNGETQTKLQETEKVEEIKEVKQIVKEIKMDEKVEESKVEKSEILEKTEIVTESKEVTKTEKAEESGEEVKIETVKESEETEKPAKVEIKEEVADVKVEEKGETKSVEKKEDETKSVGKKDEVKSEEKKATEEKSEEKIATEEKNEVKLEEKAAEERKVINQNGDPEAENISDDELPGVQVAKVPETEEVSDEELPGPKRAELPADTEVVSEDELPTTKKDAEDDEAASGGKKEGGKRKLSDGDYDPTSPTSENEAPAKKSKDEKDDKDKEGGEAKPSKPKKLPELDKYWKAVNDDPTDFTGWTYLLQYVDQENDMEAAREAYDAFLSHYPYCYGYWRKYADYEKRKGNKKKCEEVFERGLKAIPLSVDLWIHYLTYVKSTRGEDEEFVRSQFERALAACGLEFRSDRLWDSYIKWETEGKRLQKVTALFDRLLVTPTQGYTTHFDNFQEHVSSNTPNKILEVDEFMAFRKEVRNLLKDDDKAADNADLPPGDEDSKLFSSDEETKCIRERIVSIRRKAHKNTVNAVTARWNFEEGIKRPYFHVKPLERCQLKNWQEYLDYEIEQGDRVRIIVLFERCLIACALYEEFWLKFVHYLEGLKDPELQTKVRDVYERACTIHHLKKPNLHLQWAIFEEASDNVNRAAEILVNLEKQVPNVLQVAYRRINLERRRSDTEKCIQLFEHYIGNSKNKMISSTIAIKYSRFCLRVLKDFEKAQEALRAAITKDPNNPRLYLQLIDLILQKTDANEAEVCAVIEEFLEKETADPDQKFVLDALESHAPVDVVYTDFSKAFDKALFAQRKLEYLEDFGSSVESVQAAYDQYQKYQKLCKEASKKKEPKSDSTSSSKKEKPASSSTTQSTSASYPNYNYGSSSTQPSYPYSGTQQGQYNYQQYGQGDQYQYQNWQYPQGGYGGYNQWGGYGGGYSY